MLRKVALRVRYFAPVGDKNRRQKIMSEVDIKKNFETLIKENRENKEELEEKLEKLEQETQDIKQNNQELKRDNQELKEMMKEILKRTANGA